MAGRDHQCFIQVRLETRTLHRTAHHRPQSTKPASGQPRDPGSPVDPVPSESVGLSDEMLRCDPCVCESAVIDAITECRGQLAELACGIARHSTATQRAEPDQQAGGTVGIYQRQERGRIKVTGGAITLPLSLEVSRSNLRRVLAIECLCHGEPFNEHGPIPGVSGVPTPAAIRPASPRRLEHSPFSTAKLDHLVKGGTAIQPDGRTA